MHFYHLILDKSVQMFPFLLNIMKRTGQLLHKWHWVPPAREDIRVRAQGWMPSCQRGFPLLSSRASDPFPPKNVEPCHSCKSLTFSRESGLSVLCENYRLSSLLAVECLSCVCVYILTQGCQWCASQIKHNTLPPVGQLGWDSTYGCIKNEPVTQIPFSLEETLVSRS